MTSSELYHGFGLKGYTTTRTRFEDGRMILEVENTKALTCSNCRSRDVVRRGSSTRDFRMPPIGLMPVVVRVVLERVACRVCGVVRQIHIPFAAPRRHYTRRFEKYVLALLRMATPQDVARLLGLSWDTVKDIDKRNLSRRHGKPPLNGVRRIAIDELHIGKDGYITIVLDLDSGRVLYVGSGKDGHGLTAFWRRVRRCKACKIKAVAIDMSVAYTAAVKNNARDAALVE